MSLYIASQIIAHFGCVKAPGLNDRKRVNIDLIWTRLRSFNRGSFHACQNAQLFATLCIIRILILLALVCSCARHEVICKSETVTALTILSTKATNEGAPFYVVMKFTDFAGFLVDDYQTVADLSCSTETNASFTSFCLIPGKKETRIARPPPGQSTAIYCLFTNCGEKWKHLIDVDEYCKEVIITLGEHEIISVERR